MSFSDTGGSMTETTKLKPSDYLTVREAAIYLNVGKSTLDKYRIEKKGPPFLRFGKKILYNKPALLAWLEQNSK
jgi:excisionase family DNA binding protein